MAEPVRSTCMRSGRRASPRGSRSPGQACCSAAPLLLASRCGRGVAGRNTGAVISRDLPRDMGGTIIAIREAMICKRTLALLATSLLASLGGAMTGCNSSGAPGGPTETETETDPTPTGPTYYQDIAPILGK